jgi:hypothetical protein
MKPIRQIILHVGVLVAAFFSWPLERIGRLFRSSSPDAQPHTGKLQALKRREMENERLDRLRNPRNYQGK